MGLPFSPGIKFSNRVFVAGQGPLDKGGRVVRGDIEVQTRVTLDNFKRVVEAAGSNMDNVLQTTVYLTDLDDYSGMNEVYSRFFKEPRPARATVRVSDLLFGVHVEIQGIACVSSRTKLR